SEPDTHSILIFDIHDVTPSFVARIGGQGQKNGEFLRPTGMSFDARRDALTVSDSGNRRLQQIKLVRDKDKDGKVKYVKDKSLFVKAFGKPDPPKDKLVSETLRDVPGFLEPGAQAVDSEDNIYVCDPANSRIHDIT